MTSTSHLASRGWQFESFAIQTLHGDAWRCRRAGLCRSAAGPSSSARMKASWSPRRRPPASPPRAAMSGASADPLSQGNDDSLWSAHIGHAPDVLILTDAADQGVAIRSQQVDRCLQVVDLE